MEPLRFASVRLRRWRNKPGTRGELALEATFVLEGIMESVATGMVVDLDQVRSRE